MNRFGLAVLFVLIVAVVVFFATVQIRVEQPVAPGKASTEQDAEHDAARSGTAALPDGALLPGTRIPVLHVPVDGVAIAAIADSWGDERGGGMRGHTGTDILAASGTRVVAAAPGTVEKLFFSTGGGGITAYVRSPDKRWIYYYAHLAGYTPGLTEGQRVRAGDPIGFVGDTGNAGTGNFHLHFGVSQARPDEHWYQGRAVDPYPLLLAGARQGG